MSIRRKFSKVLKTVLSVCFGYTKTERYFKYITELLWKWTKLRGNCLWEKRNKKDISECVWYDMIMLMCEM